MTRLVFALIGLVMLATFASADSASTKAKIETIDKAGRVLWRLNPDDKLIASFLFAEKPPVQLVIEKNGKNKNKDLTVTFTGSIILVKGNMVAVSHFPIVCTDKRADGTVDSCKQRGLDGKWKVFRGKAASDRFQTFYESMIGVLEAAALETVERERQKALDAEEEARREHVKDSI